MKKEYTFAFAILFLTIIIFSGCGKVKSNDNVSAKSYTTLMTTKIENDVPIKDESVSNNDNNKYYKVVMNKLYKLNIGKYQYEYVCTLDSNGEGIAQYCVSDNMVIFISDKAYKMNLDGTQKTVLPLKNLESALHMQIKNDCLYYFSSHSIFNIFNIKTHNSKEIDTSKDANSYFYIYKDKILFSDESNHLNGMNLHGSGLKVLNSKETGFGYGTIYNDVFYKLDDNTNEIEYMNIYANSKFECLEKLNIIKKNEGASDILIYKNKIYYIVNEYLYCVDIKSEISSKLFPVDFSSIKFIANDRLYYYMNGIDNLYSIHLLSKEKIMIKDVN